MFYGRLLAGIRSKQCKSVFSANHSYYDTSNISEYVRTGTAKRSYPIIKGKDLRILFYPSMSPTEGKLQIIIYHDEDKEYTIYDEYACFDKEIVNINISEKIEKLKVKNPRLCEVIFTANKDMGHKVPARINHQVIYSDYRSPLSASINVSLHHKNSIQSINLNILHGLKLLIKRIIKAI